MYYALIRLGLVTQIIVADEEFLSHIENKYDYVVDVTNRERPEAGDSYYPDVDKFISNNTDEIDLSIEDKADYLTQGYLDSIEPFALSKYSVSYSKGEVTIGCKKYSVSGLICALHRVLVKREQTVEVFTVGNKGPAHGKFGITWDDAQLLYDTLIQLRITQ